MVDGDLSVSVRSVSTRERANKGSIAHIGLRRPGVRQNPSREGGSDARRSGSRDRKPARGDPGRDGEGGRLLPQADRADDGAPRGRRGDRLPARGRYRERGARAEDGGDAPAGGGIRRVGLLPGEGTEGRGAGGLGHAVARDGPGGPGEVRGGAEALQGRAGRDQEESRGERARAGREVEGGGPPAARAPRLREHGRTSPGVDRARGRGRADEQQARVVRVDRRRADRPRPLRKGVPGLNPKVRAEGQQPRLGGPILLGRFELLFQRGDLALGDLLLRERLGPRQRVLARFARARPVSLLVVDVGADFWIQPRNAFAKSAPSSRFSSRSRRAASTKRARSWRATLSRISRRRLRPRTSRARASTARWSSTRLPRRARVSSRLSPATRLRFCGGRARASPPTTSRVSIRPSPTSANP